MNAEQVTPEQSPSNIYMERNGSGIDTDITMLMSPPERPLTDMERQEVSQYAHDLMVGQVGDVRVESDKSLLEIYTTSATKNQHTYYVDYFMDHGNTAGRDILLGHGYEGAWDREEIKKFLVNSPNMQQLENKSRSTLATNSLKYTKQVTADHLTNDPLGQTDYIFTEWDSVTCDYTPDMLIGKFKDLLAYRAFYKELAGQYPEEVSDLNDAKKAVLNIHRGRVNSMIAELYPNLLGLKDQMAYADDQQVIDIGVQIAQLGPMVERLFTTEQEKSIDAMYRRLDYLRNGVQIITDPDQKPYLSSVSVDLLQALEEQDKAEQMPVSSEVDFDVEELQVMDSMAWGPQEAKSAAEAILAEWGQLSSEQVVWDQVNDRDGKAADGKFQVVISPEKDAMSVNGSKYVVTIPESFNRTLTQDTPSGALLVVAHEMAHVAQNLADSQLAAVLPIAEIKGRNVSATREAGGLYQEAVIRKHIGRSVPIATNYLAALRIKQSGGNRIQASRAFFDNYIQAGNIDLSNEAEVKKAAALAVDRTDRLYRFGGHNTQPLAYAEQALIVGALNRQPPERAAAFVIASGSFNIKDALTLHRFGLLPPIETSHNPAESMLKLYKEKISPMIYNSGR